MKKRNGLIIICEIPDHYNAHPKLTLGKEYTIIEEIENKFLIEDDSGRKTTYYQGRFKMK